MADITNPEINVIKYLDSAGLNALWEKISNTYLRQANIVDALTKYGEENIIKEEGGTFIQKTTLDEVTTELREYIGQIEAQGANIDNDTIVNKDGKLQTNLLLQNDKDKHVLKIVTGAENGQGTIVSEWDYTEFYIEAVKDGILDNVSLVVVPTNESGEESGQSAGTYLKFVFNTSSGKQPLYVNVTDLIDVYTGSTYVKVEKKDGSSQISIDTTELVEYLKTDEALGITSITTRIEGLDGELNGIKSDIEALQETLGNLNLQEISEKLEGIQETLKTVPTEPISLDDINNLV